MNILGIRKRMQKMLLPKHNKPGRNTGKQLQGLLPFALILCLHVSASSQARIKCQLKVARNLPITVTPKPPEGEAFSDVHC